MQYLSDYFLTQLRDLTTAQIEAVIADNERKAATCPDVIARSQYAAKVQAARVELIRRDKAQSLQQNICRICTKSFTQPAEEIPLVYCEPCFEKAILATVQVSADGVRVAA